MLSRSRQALLYAVEAGYRSTTDGSVISSTGKKLKLFRCGRSEYLAFHVHNNSRGIRSNVFVHALVAYEKYGISMFRPTIQVRHRNGIHTDNSHDNILIGTKSQNERDKSPYTRRRAAKEAAAVRRKLTYEDAEDLRQDRRNGRTYKFLMEKYGIAKSTVSYIVNNKTYTPLCMPP